MSMLPCEFKGRPAMLDSIGTPDRLDVAIGDVVIRFLRSTPERESAFLLRDTLAELVESLGGVFGEPDRAAVERALARGLAVLGKLERRAS